MSSERAPIMDQETANIVKAVVAGSISGVGTVYFTVRAWVKDVEEKMLMVVVHETRLRLTEQAVKQQADTHEAMAEAVLRLETLTGRVAEDVAFLRGRAGAPDRRGGSPS